MTKIIINPIGGLANRMRCIASGIALAMATGSDYEVVWAVNDELAARYEDLFILPDVLKDRIKYPSKAIYRINYSIPRLRNLYITSLTLKRYSHRFFDEFASLDDVIQDSKQRLFGNTGNRKGTIYIQAGTVFYPFSNQYYRTLFNLNPEIENRVNIKKRMLGNDYIGIHIRRSDNLMSVKYSPDELFITEIEKILSQNPHTKFYLATDSEETKVKFITQFGEDTIFCSRNPATRTTLNGIKDATEELFILAGAKKILGSYYSSFSESASIIGNAPLVQVSSKN